MNYISIQRISLYTCIILLFIFFSQPSWSSSCSLDKLHQISKQSFKFRNLSKQNFIHLIKTKNISEFSNLFRQLPYEERISILLEIAAEKKLIKHTEIPSLYSKFSNLDNGDKVLIHLIENEHHDFSTVANFQTINTHSDFLSNPRSNPGKANFSSTLNNKSRMISNVSPQAAVPSQVEINIMKSGEKTTCNGKEVIKRSQIIPSNARDAKGRTNCDRMNVGLSPLGFDGKEIHLHHHQQNDAGPIIEMSQTEHHQNYSDLHSFRKTSEIDRDGFLTWRQNYWKERAKEICQ